MSKKFQCIICDPPWNFGDKLQMSSTPRGAAANYSTITTEDIATLPIKEITDPDGCVLALWVPSSLIEDGIKVMKAWGFEIKQTYIWSKIKKEPLRQLIPTLLEQIIMFPKQGKNQWSMFFKGILSNFKMNNILSFGLGRLFRQSHEIALIGINSTKIYKSLTNKSQRSVCFAPNLGHSTKPDHLHESLEIMFAGKNINKLELFARRERTGWACLGDEIDGQDIREALAKIIQ